MENSDETREKRDEEIAQVADVYFQARKNGTTNSIDAFLEKYPQLGDELRESLEAIDLLLAAPREQKPEIVDDFQIHHELGRGGMGIVYLATQISLQRKVALKVLKFSANDSIAAERFAKEARTVAELRHDRIVPIYAAGAIDGPHWDKQLTCHYFAMQWIEGDSVAQLIAKQKGAALSPLDERKRVSRIAKWGAQIAEALEYAHKQGVVHRDIKPSNLIVDQEQRIWLTDFGLARQDEDTQVSPSIAYQGTPNYMSPEQASAIAGPVDLRTDIYSLGVTLIEWITGQSVVGGSNPVESLTRLQHNSLEEPRVLLQGYSRDLVAVMEKCVAREPKDRYQSAEDLANDLNAFANSQPVAARRQHAAIRFLRGAINQKTVVQTAIVSVAAIGLMWLSSAAWRAYADSKLHPVIFESRSGEWLTVTASDTADKPISTFMVPSEEVLLPGKEVRLDVNSSQRLGYRRTIDPTSSNIDEKVKTIYLDDPQSHRWVVDDILWYQSLDILRNGTSANCCIALRSDGLVLLDTSSGNSLWSFHDANTLWGNSVRGCPSSFQPDRCVVIQDTNDNGCQEIIFAHPQRPELLCLDGEDGEQLWRTNLLDSASIQTPNPLSVCPIVLKEFNHVVGSELCVVVAPYVAELTVTNRWLMSVDPVLGKVRWKLASQQSLANPAKVQTTSARPLHLQWGEVEKRPLDFSDQTTLNYFDDYWKYVPNSGWLNPYDYDNVRLGTDRPFALAVGDTANWHWIDGQDWHKIDARSGKLIKTWKLPSDCVGSPQLLRTTDGRPLALTVLPGLSNETDFAAWDVAADAVVWERTIESDLGRLPQSYLSRELNFPIVTDLDGDGADEWIAPSHVSGTKWSNSMKPPYGMVMAHKGNDGKAIWKQPFYLPNSDEMIERGVMVSDQDGDGWKDLLLATRFQGGGVRGGVACFVDLVSGRTGHRIWHSQVRTESSKPTLGPNELVDLKVLEDKRMIAVVTHSGAKVFNMESPRPYSTTFLNLDSGAEEAFGLGIRATSFSHDTWLEHRLPPSESGPHTRQLVGWAYPNMKKDSIDNLTLWRSEDHSCSLYTDVDHDGFPEVIGTQIRVGYREEVLLNGLTGKKSWSIKTPTQKGAPSRNMFWHELEQDVDKDGLDDLVVLISDADYGSPGLPKDQLQFATLEIVSGATGRTIWKHTANELGMVDLLAFFKRDSGRLPLLIYQHDRSKKVTCVDVDSRKTAWASDSFTTKLESQAFKTWVHDGKIIWFSLNEAEPGSANFVDAETGKTLLQIPIGQRPAAPWANWIEWDGRELLPIQTITEFVPVIADSAASYRTDLWLVDRSINLVGHWSETTSVAAGAVAANWFQKSHYDLPLPKVVKTPDSKELLAIPTSIDGSIGFRLLGFDDAEPQNVVVDRTVRLPIDRNSTSAFVETLDCDGDGYSDFVSLSDSGLDCTSVTGDLLWHRPVTPTA